MGNNSELSYRWLHYDGVLSCTCETPAPVLLLLLLLVASSGAPAASCVKASEGATGFRSNGRFGADLASTDRLTCQYWRVKYAVMVV